VRRRFDESVRRRPHSPGSAIQDLGVDHRRPRIAMPEQRLDRADVVAVFEGATRPRAGRCCRGSRASSFLRRRRRCAGRAVMIARASRWTRPVRRSTRVVRWSRQVIRRSTRPPRGPQGPQPRGGTRAAV